MRTIDDIGVFAMDQFHLLLCEVSPEEINDIVVETIDFSDDAISEIHPTELRGLFAAPSLTVKEAFKSRTPCSAHLSSEPCLGMG